MRLVAIWRGGGSCRDLSSLRLGSFVSILGLPSYIIHVVYLDFLFEYTEPYIYSTVINNNGDSSFLVYHFLSGLRWVRMLRVVRFTFKNLQHIFAARHQLVIVPCREHSLAGWESTTENLPVTLVVFRGLGGRFSPKLC